MNIFGRIFDEAVGEAFRSFYTKPEVSELVGCATAGDRIVITLGDYPSRHAFYERGIESKVRVFLNYNPLDPEYYAEETSYSNGKLPVHAPEVYVIVKEGTIVKSLELTRRFEEKGVKVQNMVPDAIRLKENSDDRMVISASN
jgi:hypothetical protein